ncbi:hypothetical protein HanIR_Chr08g0379791 [Helianthus annuus]|nr:hypothetical protein HanIR_Chr08g0379791 [Helianthus annuus]
MQVIFFFFYGNKLTLFGTKALILDFFLLHFVNLYRKSETKQDKHHLICHLENNYLPINFHLFCMSYLIQKHLHRFNVSARIFLSLYQHNKIFLFLFVPNF